MKAAELAEKIRAIKLVVFDFDGVFTDNRVLVSQDGVEHVSCWRGDGIGLDLLRKLEIELLVISTEKNPVVTKRCEKLKLPFLQAVSDKLAVLKLQLKDRELKLSETAYMGNDINDEACLAMVGLPIIPADAHPEVRQPKRWQTQLAGGRGAVREVCDRFWEIRGDHGAEF